MRVRDVWRWRTFIGLLLRTCTTSYDIVSLDLQIWPVDSQLHHWRKPRVSRLRRNLGPRVCGLGEDPSLAVTCGFLHHFCSLVGSLLIGGSKACRRDFSTAR
ncbi:hypothetical protein BS17DRAFT_594187 [Gyrodon lividus]|nr:hypothetical protein BS17DRAFT_594187 [Gyrodon lividus]